LALPSPPSLQYSTISADRTSITITDVSTYTSPARNAVGVYLKAKKMKYDSTVQQVLTSTGNNNDPNSDSIWTILISQGDGWHRFPFVIIPDYDTGTTYAQYDAVFEPTSKTVYRSVQAGNLNNSLTDNVWWELIADPAELAENEGETNQSGNISSTIYEIEVLGNSEYYFSNAIAIASTEGGDAERERNVNIYELLAVLVDGCYVDSDRAQYADGERIARRIQSLAIEFQLT